MTVFISACAVRVQVWPIVRACVCVRNINMECLVAVSRSSDSVTHIENTLNAPPLCSLRFCSVCSVCDVIRECRRSAHAFLFNHSVELSRISFCMLQTCLSVLLYIFSNANVVIGASGRNGISIEPCKRWR